MVTNFVNFRKSNYSLIILNSFIALFISCQVKDSNNFDENLVKAISIEKTDLPSKFSSIPLFCRCSNSEVAEVYINELRYLYKNESDNLDFERFLNQILNQKIKIKTTKIKCFKLNTKVVNSYKKNEFKVFFNLYTEKLGSGRVVLKSKIKDEELNSVLYYLFLNNYLSSYDDNIDKHFIRTTKFYYTDSVR